MTRSKSLPYLPGLDGLRALAVIAVVLYHSGQNWLPGGFLGVEIFFVISGYIITSGLLAEWRESNRVDCWHFWSRRARRLLPALYAMLAALLLAALAAMPYEVDELRRDALAAIGYVTNWNLILAHQSYFESFERPPLLQHLWSLAVEEQFYIVWPLIFAVLVRFLRPRFIAVMLLIGALVSTVLMALLFDNVYDTSRLYYATDTRASGLLLGSALAVLLRPGTTFGSRGSLLTAASGVLGLAGLVTLCLQLDQYDAVLYQGGFLITGVASVAAIAAVARPESIVSRLVGIAPLRWVGMRSYGIYLWHWPVLLLTEPDNGSTLSGLAVRLVLVLLLSEASYRLVETPARNGAFGRLWRSLTMPPFATFRRAFSVAAATVAVAAFSVSIAVVSAPTATASRSTLVDVPLIVDPGYSGELVLEEDPLESMIPTPQPEAPAEEAPSPSPEPPPVEPTPVPTPPPPPLPVVGTAPIPEGVQITAVGDSVMLGAARQILYTLGNVEIDAEIGRQTSTGVDILRDRHASGRLGNVAVIGFGSNGGFSARQFDQMMELLADVKLVVFVNVRVPRPWEDPNNGVIARGVAAYPNTVLVDWHAASEGHPELFGEDKVHLTGTGMRLYAGLVADAIIANWK